MSYSHAPFPKRLNQIKSAFLSSCSMATLAMAFSLSGQTAMGQTVQQSGGGQAAGCTAANALNVTCLGAFNSTLDYEVVGAGNGNGTLFIGNTTGSAGSTSVTTATGPGVKLNVDAGVGGLHALRLQSSGVVSTTGLNGHGLDMFGNGSDDATILNFGGSISTTGSGADGMRLIMGIAGGGTQENARIVNASGGTVTSAQSNGMFVDNSSNTSHFVSVENSGTVTGGTSGSAMRGRIGLANSSQRINMVNGTNGTLNQRSNVGGRAAMEAEQLGTGTVDITNSGTIDAHTGANVGRGMSATVANSASTGAVTLINQSSGQITTDRGGMRVNGQTSGGVTIINAGTITDTNLGAGIMTNVAGVGRSGTSTVTNSGTINTTNAAAIQISDISSGTQTITNSGTLTVTNNDGIYIDGGNRAGATVISNTGTISSSSTGINYDGQSSNGTVSITSSGTIATTASNGNGIFAGSDSLGLLKVEVTDSGTANDEISTTGNSAIGARVDATNGANGIDVDLGQDASIRTTGNNAHGLFVSTVDQVGNTSAMDVDVAGSITTTGAANAIQVNITQGQAGTSNNYGSIDIAGTGQIQAANGDGIHVFATSSNAATSAQLDVNIAAGAQVTATTGYGFHNPNAANNVDLINVLDVAGTLSGGTGAANLGSGNDTFIWRETATVTGLIDGGADTDELQLDFASAKTLDVSQFTNFETVTKTSSGQLTFSGTNADTMSVMLQQGSISFNGTMAGSAVTASTGTTVMGSGTIGSLTANGAIVAPGNSIGTLTVQGDVAFGDNATYAVEVDQNGNSDLINAAGGATISSNGTTLSVSGPNVIYPTGTNTYRVLNATGGVTGQFATVTDSIPDVDFAAVYGANSIDVQYVKDAGTTGNPASPTQTTSTNLSDKSIYPATSLAMLEASQLFAETLGQRARRRFINPLPAQGDGGYLTGGPRGFANTMGRVSRIDQAFNTPTYRNRIGGFAAGLEQSVDVSQGAAFVGFAAGYTTGQVESGSTSASTDFAHFGVFGSLVNQGWKLSGSGTYQYGRYDTNRLLNLGTGFATAENSLSSNSVAGSLELSYEMTQLVDESEISLRPYARLDGAFGNIDGGTETGAGILNLTVDPANPSQLYGEAGIVLSAELVRASMVVKPKLGLGYRYLISTSDLDSTTTLQTTGQIFSDTGIARDRSSFVASAGFEVQLPEATMNFAYSGELASSHQQHAVSTSIGWKF